MDNPQEKKRIAIVEVRRGKKVGTDASDCGGSSRIRSDGIRVRNVITISNSGYLLRFTCTGDVRFARLGEVPPGQVRPKSLTCTPKQPQRPSRGTSAGQVNCRKCGRDRSAKGCRMRVENVCGPTLAGVDIAATGINRKESLTIAETLPLTDTDAE